MVHHSIQSISSERTLQLVLDVVNKSISAVKDTVRVI